MLILHRKQIVQFSCGQLCPAGLELIQQITMHATTFKQHRTSNSAIEKKSLMPMIQCIIQGFSMYKKFIDLKKVDCVMGHGLINWLLFTVCYRARTACTYMYSSTLCRLHTRVYVSTAQSAWK
jgi:hypothetical protein